MTKIRTINQTIQLLKEKDPYTAITERALRKAIKDNLIPYRTIGNKVLLNFDLVCDYFLIARESE